MISTTEQEISNHSVYSEVVLSVNGVSKKFCRDLKRSLFYGVQDIASELVGVRNTTEKLRPQEFWALKDVSFQLRRGEALGLVGKNGSGKSTLLRIIAGLIKPDAGSVEVIGRVAPLIALGAGFNPVLTGRENIYANMSILGLSKKEIDERFDEVVEFAEIGDAIDAPVRSYSSGMAARLGFSCAIHTEPDILLIDEVLAVGDIRFRSKCYRKLNQLRQRNISFVLVSHQAHAILTACESAIYLSNGNLIDKGDTYSIMSRYENDLFSTDKDEDAKKINGKTFFQKKKEDSTGFSIISMFFRNGENIIVNQPVSGEKTTLCLEYKANKNIDFNDVYLSFTISEMGGEADVVLRLSSFDDKAPLRISLENHQIFFQGEIQVQMPYLGLRPGTYTMKTLIKKDALDTLDYIESFRFVVDSRVNMSKCLFYQPRMWTVENKVLDETNHSI
ncbi:MAG: polysaccharide ABC transporter ATP-binding protein [Lyngbya sp.]|nr:polysaccharide ABC transporter ATP-binding protein [Lyngbya sp.]